jgi:hypothetical protein
MHMFESGPDRGVPARVKLAFAAGPGGRREEKSMARENILTGPFNMHWGAILSGAFVSLGAWMFFLALGSAIGGARTFGAWTTIYTLLSPILGLYAGGLVAARSRAMENKADGALHGVVVWGFAMVLGAVLLASFGGAIAGVAPNVVIPRGYSWAICGSILGSLISCVAGASTVPAHGYERESTVAPSVRRGEVHT